MSRSALDLEREDVEATVVLRLRGELDLHTHQRLRDEVMATSMRGVQLVVDLSEVSFLDSSGIGALGLAHQEVGDGELVLVVTSGHLRKLIKIAGLDRSARLCATVPEALSALPPTS